MKMRLLIVSVLLAFGFPVIMNEVVDSFDKCSQFFFDEQSPVIPQVLNNSVSQDNNRYKIICQKYRNAYRFATLYDTNKKIPVFSAYRYTGRSTEETNITLMIEPQLEFSYAEMRVPCVNQASTEDYRERRLTNITRSHLFPNSCAVDRNTAESTFTLTNAVPQYSTFNNGSWIPMEQKLRETMDCHCRDQNNAGQTLAFVLTGAVASANDITENSTVNIPSDMWSVFCCYNHNTKKWASQAHWAENKQTNNEAINARTLQELQVFLNGKYGSGATLFNDKCLDFLNVTQITFDKKTEDNK